MRPELKSLAGMIKSHPEGELRRALQADFIFGVENTGYDRLASLHRRDACATGLIATCR